jgi:ATP-dependent RNA helicase DeaD
MTGFRELGITEPVLRVIENENFKEPSEIQRKAIPLVLEGRDVVAGSATGSGKTLVFGSVIIQNSERGGGIQSLVLTPTRELAVQNTKALRKFSKYKPLNVIPVYGGVSISPQIERLKTADVAVGTPGRVLDHIGRRTIDLRNVKILVLDEADTMLDMGFIEDVEKIIRSCPGNRQTLLFSATITMDVAHLARDYMDDPVDVSAENYIDADKLEQVYYDVPDNLKFSLLVHLLKHERGGLVMVFCNTREYVDFVADNLERAGVKSMAIHGGITQDKRDRIMEKFHSSEVYVLVCTDVAARGLDIRGVSHVYNYDIPKDSKHYIHRVGRTARAGKRGKAINILGGRDHDNFRCVLQNSELNIEKAERPRIERIRTMRNQRRRMPSGSHNFTGRDHGRGRRHRR